MHSHAATSPRTRFGEVAYHEFYRDDFTPREHYRPLWEHIRRAGQSLLGDKSREAHLALHGEGVTFTVYGDEEEGIERVWPLDLLPRIIPAAEWAPLETGLKQRGRALDCFLQDVYGEQRALRDGVVPAELVHRGRDYRAEIAGIRGIHNSAYFEHTFLAREMGIELAEGRDLVVANDVVYLKTTHGLERVDVLYRRVDDDFLDPLCFRPESTLGAAGLVNAWRAGNVAIVNAPGTGIADDKAVYPYVPDLIRYYLGKPPVLENVPTFRMTVPEERDWALHHLDPVVVKAVSESGGYGMLMGPTAQPALRAEFARRILEDPRNYVAQPVVPLSRHLCWLDGELESRHIDLRPFVIHGEEIHVVPGGLTRVALTKGSLVVNSSQGGGSKDTWVLADAEPDR